MTMKMQMPGIGYKQGGRLMVATAIDPPGLVKVVSKPDVWDPLGKQAHGNRPLDPKHQAGITAYLETQEKFVIGGVVLYVSPKDAKFVPARIPKQGAAQDDDRVAATSADIEEPCPGTLLINIGARFDIGDGQHRIAAYADVIRKHSIDGDEDDVMARLRASGQPVIIVIDDEPLNRAQDFCDLQRNARPPTGSIGMSMDRRQPINEFCINLVQRDDVPILAHGERVEFLKDSPGKLSAKLFSFKTLRYVTGTALIGVTKRGAKEWEQAVNECVSADPKLTMERMIDLWTGLGEMDVFAAVLGGKRTAANVRQETIVTSAGALHAIAYALHMAYQELGVPFGEAARALGSVDFNRPKRTPTEEEPLTKSDSLFVGNLINMATGQVISGRPAWEEAAVALYEHIRQELKEPKTTVEVVDGATAKSRA